MRQQQDSLSFKLQVCKYKALLKSNKAPWTDIYVTGQFDKMANYYLTLIFFDPYTPWSFPPMCRLANLSLAVASFSPLRFADLLALTSGGQELEGHHYLQSSYIQVWKTGECSHAIQTLKVEVQSMAAVSNHMYFHCHKLSFTHKFQCRCASSSVAKAQTISSNEVWLHLLHRIQEYFIQVNYHMGKCPSSHKRISSHLDQM